MCVKIAPYGACKMITHTLFNDSGLNKHSHSVTQNWYHMVLTPKRRAKVFQWPQIVASFNEAFEILCERHKIEVFAKEILEDHIHLMLSCPDDFSLRKLGRTIKGFTSYWIRKNHPSLYKYEHFWNKGFMARTVGNVAGHVVKKYIEREFH
jgi:putative transposase